jgi:hypothetical protein
MKNRVTKAGRVTFYLYVLFSSCDFIRGLGFYSHLIRVLTIIFTFGK